MRKPVLSLAVAGAVALITVSASQAQVFPPIFPRPAAPPAVAPAPAERAPIAELPQVATMRKLLAGRGFGADVTAGPMVAYAPGEARPFENSIDAEMGILPAGAFQPEAWLIETGAGRWWLWDYGAAAPADRRAEMEEAGARRNTSAEFRVD